MEQRPQPPQASLPQQKQQEIPIGTLVGGRYRIRKLLGQGGFGRSYLVSDIQRFDEQCVLKEFVPASQSGQALQKAIDLFKQEAKALYQIDHPQIPKFLAGFTQSQRLFIVQQYINGITYAQLLQQRKQQGRLFSENEVIQWLRELLPVLDYLHSLNLIHRDIAPDNIMYSHDRGLPVLIDFGLVKDSINLSIGSETTGYLRQASRLGKSGYSPPEQLSMGRCYPCSDLYALGVTAIVLLTGKNPNNLVNPDTLQWTWRSHVTLRTPIGQILDKMVMPKPKDRFQSARELLSAMQSLPVLKPESTPIVSATPSTNTRPSGPSDHLQNKQIAGSIDLSVTTPPSERLTTTSAFIIQCRQELTRCVGPIASVLINDTLTHYPDITPQGFIAVLTSHISDPKQANDFKRRIEIPNDSTTGQPSFTAPVPTYQSSGNRSSGNQGPSLTNQNSSTGAPTIDDAFVGCCRQELIRCIGPIAKVVVKQVLADYPYADRAMLVEILAAKIPDPRLAAEFRQRLKSAQT
jgi:serine/threonine protein kinase